jgi:hypothetical protein
MRIKEKGSKEKQVVARERMRESGKVKQKRRNKG